MSATTDRTLAPPSPPPPAPGPSSADAAVAAAYKQETLDERLAKVAAAARGKEEEERAGLTNPWRPII